MTTDTLEAKKSFSPKAFIDQSPHIFLLLLICLGSLALMGFDFVNWITMTVAGLAMGLLIFVMSSGMTLTFGLMGVLNLGHGAFITIGAFVGASVVLWIGDVFPTLQSSTNILVNLGAMVPALIIAFIVGGIAGYVFERIIIKPVGYHDHLKQILVTVGGAIIIGQLIVVFWGPNEIPLPRPEGLRGAWILGPVAIEKFRIYAVFLGLGIYFGMLALINKTKVGLLIRAGVENSEMVEAFGYRIKLLFIAVFMAGSALAAFGGVMWGLYEELLTIQIGELRLVEVIIVIIIGGLGSIKGCFYGALLVGLIRNYVGFIEPTFAEFSAVALMVGVLMWRPQGLIPVIRM